MSNVKTYASIAIVEFTQTDKIVLEILSITPEVCDLSGAWVLKKTDQEIVHDLVNGRLLIILGENQQDRKSLGTSADLEVDLQEFIDEAKFDASNAIASYGEYLAQNERDYSAYMAVKPVERKLLPKVIKKKLVEPTFYSWPKDFSVADSLTYLESIGKKGKIVGTPTNVENVLMVARLTKHFIDMWHSDEIERNNRLYVDAEEAVVSIIPNCWLKKMNG